MQMSIAQDELPIGTTGDKSNIVRSHQYRHPYAVKLFKQT